jgi:hypothetical protein
LKKGKIAGKALQARNDIAGAKEGVKTKERRSSRMLRSRNK